MLSISVEIVFHEPTYMICLITFSFGHFNAVIIKVKFTLKQPTKHLTASLMSLFMTPLSLWVFQPQWPFS